jgi:uncharacterized protein YraI
MPRWKSITLSATLLAAATGFAAAVTVRSDIVLRAGPGADFSAIGHVPAGSELETTDCAGGWCRVGFNGIAGFVGADDVGNDEVIRSSSARRAKNAHRARITHRLAPVGSVTHSSPAGEDADLFVLPARVPSRLKAN